RERRRGQSFLGLVLIIGGIVAAVGIFIAFLALSAGDTGYCYGASVDAEAVAIFGGQGGVLPLHRKLYFFSGGYTLPVGSSTASVMVTQNAPSSGFATIVSSATVVGRTRKISVVMSIATTTDQASVVSWTETQ